MSILWFIKLLRFRQRSRGFIGASADASLATVLPGHFVWQFDARLNGYSGGQNIDNLIKSPADSSAQSVYAATLGDTSSVGGNDPGFSTDHWTFDGGDYIRVGGASPTTFHANMSTSQSWTFYCQFDTPASWASASTQFISSGGVNAATAGVTLRYISASNYVRLSTSDGVSSNTQNLATPASQLATSTAYKMAFAYNPTTKAYKLYLNATTPVTSGTAASALGATSTSPLNVFSTMIAGVKLYGAAISNGYDDDSDVTAVFNYWDNLASYALLISGTSILIGSQAITIGA